MIMGFTPTSTLRTFCTKASGSAVSPGVVVWPLFLCFFVPFCGFFLVASSCFSLFATDLSQHGQNVLENPFIAAILCATRSAISRLCS